MAAAPKSNDVKTEALPLKFAAIAKDVLFTAILAFVIVGPILGLKTFAISGSLALEQRWGLVALFAAIAAPKIDHSG